MILAALIAVVAIVVVVLNLNAATGRINDELGRRDE